MKSIAQGIHHTAISVRNLEKSLKFYIDLGFLESSHYTSDDESLHIVQLELNNTQLELFWYPKNTDGQELDLEYANKLDEVGVKHFGVRVLDIEDALQMLIELEYANTNTEIKTARSLKNSRYFFIKDPDGMWVEFMEDNRQEEIA